LLWFCGFWCWVCWVMWKSVVELLACWQGQYGHHRNGYIWMAAPHCLMWCFWRERNNQSFEDIERSLPDLKLLHSQSLCLVSLFFWQVRKSYMKWKYYFIRKEWSSLKNMYRKTTKKENIYKKKNLEQWNGITRSDSPSMRPVKQSPSKQFFELRLRMSQIIKNMIIMIIWLATW